MSSDILTRRQLLERGLTRAEIARAIRDGALVRLRRDRYAFPHLDESLQAAVRVGGGLTCVSELRRCGVWVLDDGRLHVHVPRNASRLREATSPTAGMATSVRVHWTAAQLGASASSHATVAEALLHATDCLSPVALAAAVDSAVHRRLITLTEARRVVARMPERYRAVIRPDARVESGLETIVIALARALGFRVVPQPRFPGVGRADALVEGWVLVECDGAEFHAAEVTTRDRRRDAGFQRTGRTALHFRFAQVVYGLRELAETLIAAVENHRRVPDAAHLARRARRRLPAVLEALGDPASGDRAEARSTSQRRKPAAS